MNWRLSFVALACTAWCSSASSLFLGAKGRGMSSDLASSVMQMEAEDRSFLLSQLDQTETSLLSLVKLLQLEGASSSTTPAKVAKQETKATALAKALTTSAQQPAAKAPEKTAAKAATAAKTSSTPVKANATTGAKKEVKEVKDIDPAKLIAKFGGASSKLAGKAALAPMLAMMKGLYQDSKDRIAQQNTREEKSKKWFTEKEAEHKAKMAKIEQRFKNHTLSEEFRTNETRDENRYFSYWSRCRERQHRQFHTNLKIQHAMMMKTKKMIDMYENALSSKPSDQEKVKKELQAAPEIVFVQEAQRTVSAFCSESLAEVRKERAELQDWSHLDLA